MKFWSWFRQGLPVRVMQLLRRGSVWAGEQAAKAADVRGGETNSSARCAEDQLLVMKAESYLGVDLSRIVVVKAAEGEAVIQKHAPVGYVECVYGDAC